jgi:transposase
MKAYSMDLRRRVLADCDDGMPTSAVATKYKVSTAWVRRLKQRRRETGEVEPRQGRPGPAPMLAPTTTGCATWWRGSPTSAPRSTATGSAWPAAP